MLVPYEIIKKKRDGGKLTREEIEFMVSSFTKGTLPDYQMSAFVMAIFFRKLDDEETAIFTQAMTSSGKSMNLSGIPGPTVDKHSTGGIGDKVSLPLAPLVAASGGFVPMMSGRGLGHTGGTLDKLESIPGFKVTLSDEEFLKTVKEAGCAIVGQTADIAPADKKLYAMRDVTATVDTMDLIAASILSKKFAAGPKSLVFDVKTGSGAFMRERDDARALAKLMVAICKNSNRNASALITNMDQPLGVKAGNALEIEESIDILKGKGPEDLRTLVIEFGARMLQLSGIKNKLEDGRKEIQSRINDGTGLERFRKMIELQSGDPKVCDDISRLPKAKKTFELTAWNDGNFHSIDTYAVGMAIVVLGGGRQKSSDPIDPAVGAEFLVKPGAKLSKGAPIIRIHYNDENKFQESLKRMKASIKISDAPAQTMPLILEEIS